MAFRNCNLGILAYAGGFSVWIYSTNDDTIEQVAGDGYFDDANTLFYPGDLIICRCADETMVRTISFENQTKVILGEVK